MPSVQFPCRFGARIFLFNPRSFLQFGTFSLLSSTAQQFSKLYFSQNSFTMVNEKIAKLPIVWVLGGPGSGKASVCLKLEKDFTYTNVNSGGLLRAAEATNPAIKDAMAAGQLVPQDVVLQVIEDYLLQHVDNVKGFLVVGYPRSVEQGKAFEAKFGEPKLILYLHAKDETRKARLLAAKAHADDNEATIDKRLAAYHAHSAEVVQHYTSKITHVDANRDAEAVYADCKAAIAKL